jgi:hypothetical protein
MREKEGVKKRHGTVEKMRKRNKERREGNKEEEMASIILL